MLLNIFSILLIIVVFVFIGFFANRKASKEGNSEFFAVIAFISLIIICAATLWKCFILTVTGYDFFQRNITFQEYMNEKSLTQRLLLEDYNPSNLEKALVFNNKQKLIKAENSNWLTAYGTSFVYTDTIAIPATNFMPSQRIVIKGE